MDYYFDPLTKFNLTETNFRRSILPQLKIKFHFSFKIEYLNYYLNHDRTHHEEFPSTESYATATVAIGDSLSPDDIAMAVFRAVSGLIPAANRSCCEDLIDLAIKEARDCFPAAGTLPKFSILHLSFDVRVQHRHVYHVEGDFPFTIPDAETAAAFALWEKDEEEAAFAFLETYEEEEEEEERCCCICLEEIRGGGGAERMPCLHVFHGGCIKEWLRKSPRCPLCRYVPMEIEDSTIVC